MKTKYDWSVVSDSEITHLATNGYSGAVIGFYSKPKKNKREGCWDGEGNIQNAVKFKGNWQDSLEERPI